MNGIGSINIHISSYNNARLAIDISDTGKGIPRSKFTQVFEPGYTTKQRGWGLGLTLVKRIVQNYHGGKIFVLNSELGKGTTFRILLPR
jgi:signal transduction histidine kinase